MIYNNILITGGSGFLGSHVAQRLKDGRLIIPRSSSTDLKDKHQCEQLFYREQPDAVIHLAATCGGIGANRENPGKYFYDNMLMGLNIIECCNSFNIGKLIIVGTVCSYPKHCPVPFKEEDIYGMDTQKKRMLHMELQRSLCILWLKHTKSSMV